MKRHTPYSIYKGRDADFIVEYELDPCDELKDSKPGQGMRVDFLYEGDDPQIEGVHMIWPELLDKDSNVILDVTPGLMDKCGRANMWIFDDSRRDYHAKRIKVGTKGYLVRGSYKLAKVTVISCKGLRC